MWAGISAHEAKAGLNYGPPDLEATKSIYRKMLTEGNVAQARAMEAIVTHNVR